jgi:hypothetical protein
MDTSGIAAFWSWWEGASPRIVAAIERGAFTPPLVQEIATHVTGVAPGLEWELGPGEKARHAFCLSPRGDTELRRVTELWRAAAPGGDGMWEFHPARRGRAAVTLRLDIGGKSLAFLDFVAGFTVDEARELVDVTCFHPEFEEMDEGLRASATFLMLDAAFGEDGVERWLGGIDAADEEPDDARPIQELLAAVDSLAKAATGERFSVMRGQDAEGRPLFAMVNQALKRIDHLRCDVHASVDVAVLRPTAEGLTTEEEAEALNELEDELEDALEGSGAAYFGRETGGGRRVLHWYAPSDSPAHQTLEAWAARHPERDARVDWRSDPRWEARDRFL